MRILTSLVYPRFLTLQILYAICLLSLAACDKDGDGFSQGNTDGIVTGEYVGTFSTNDTVQTDFRIKLESAGSDKIRIVPVTSSDLPAVTITIKVKQAGARYLHVLEQEQSGLILVGSGLTGGGYDGFYFTEQKMIQVQFMEKNNINNFFAYQGVKL